MKKIFLTSLLIATTVFANESKVFTGTSLDQLTASSPTAASLLSENQGKMLTALPSLEYYLESNLGQDFNVKLGLEQSIRTVDPIADEYSTLLPLSGESIFYKLVFTAESTEQHCLIKTYNTNPNAFQEQFRNYYQAQLHLKIDCSRTSEPEDKFETSINILTTDVEIDFASTEQTLLTTGSILEKRAACQLGRTEHQIPYRRYTKRPDSYEANMILKNQKYFIESCKK